MKVRVKDGKKGFIYGSMRRGADDNRPRGDEFELVPVECKVKKDAKGNPAVISPEDQFSGEWMEKVAVKRGPKPKQESAEAEADK